MRQPSRCWKTGKIQIRTWRRADKAARRLGEEVYHYACGWCGYRHVTGETQADYDRKQAQGRAATKRDREAREGKKERDQ